MDQIVEVASDNRHLKKERGFLVVCEGHKEIGRVPLDGILAVLIHAHGVTYSNNLLVALAAQGSLVVLCGANHAPSAVMMPLETNSLQGARTRAQWDAGKPLIKQLWKQIVRQKILAQADCLAAFHLPDAPVRSLVRSVRSGDEGNVEAQAARRYWRQLMGKDFRRDIGAVGHNSQLNYGYTILRSMVMRAIVSAGLNPTIGVFHSNRGNAFALADDLVEPFRPIVDALVLHCKHKGIEDLTPELKQQFSRITRLDVETDDILCPLGQAAHRLVLSLVNAYEKQETRLVYPKFPSALEIASLNEA
ncbi:type II CRISPR-associated endonuclease Cas1 [uncultured Cohaesibacter sp.]|uniref:type II CRISPR-associated endonuclease Cas1 n=1 Tax=uncultured Cohaesibacter sp. TaxID=1002546 RepID=UPI00292EB089|nr:type II CRISPR-associated endonuclease Cas1 [uncultured Cohaesibacter sp.]